MTRILQIVHQYPPEHVGGSELYTHQLAQGLIARGHEAAIFTRRNLPRNMRLNQAGNGLTLESHENVPIYAAWAGEMSPSQRYLASLGNRSLIASFQQTLDQFQPQLIHVQHLMGLPLSLIDVVKERQIPFLISVHDYWWVCSNANLITNYDGTQCVGPRAQVNCAHCVVARAGGGKAWAAVPAIWAIQQWRAKKLRRIVESAQAILAPSEFVRNWYLEHGMASAPLFTLPLGIEAPSVSLSANSADSSKPVRLLYLGGIAPIKGVHVIIEAMRNVNMNSASENIASRRVELQIAGDLTTHPDYADHLRALATANVRFLGKLSREQVWQALAQADALLVPSLSHETYCFAAREAQSVGTPLLVSEKGALTEIVRDGVNGRLLPAGDVRAWQCAIRECLDSPQMLNNFRSQAIQTMSVSEHVERMVTMYDEILHAT